MHGLSLEEILRVHLHKVPELLLTTLAAITPSAFAQRTNAEQHAPQLRFLFIVFRLQMQERTKLFAKEIQQH